MEASSFKKASLSLVAVITLLSLALITIPAVKASAARKTSSTPSSKASRVNKKLKDAKQELRKIQKSEKITLRAIEKAGRELSIVQKKHRKRKAKLDATDKEMKRIKAEVASLKDKVVATNKWLRRKLRAMNRHGKYGDVILLLGSSGDLSQFIRRWRYLEKLAASEQKAIISYNASITALNKKKAELASVLERYRAEEAEVKIVADRLKAEKRKKELMLMSVRREKQTYSRIEWELKRESARIKKVIHKSARETKTKYSGKSFRKYKGRLRWPVRGKVAVPFGKHKDPTTQTPVFRNGIYISARANTVAKSVSDGKVAYADWFEGFGQLVIVNHGGGYHTLYANLSEIFLSTGDIIKRNDEVGRVGTSGIINKPALYFEIRYKGKPLNPAKWLSR